MAADKAKYSVLTLEQHKRRCLRIGRHLTQNVPFLGLLLRAARLLPLTAQTKIQFDLIPRSHLAYGMFAAAMQAKALGLNGITAIEFGVFKGDGLQAMERHAELIESIPEFAGFRFNIIGFDRGGGMIQSNDPLDLPYWFEGGLFEVNMDEVQKKMKRAKLIVGDIADTVSQVSNVSLPIGFISFDMDAYQPTVQALRVFELPAESRLPRVLCYLDDVFGVSDLTVLGECVGEQRAILDWNAGHSRLPIHAIEGLRHKRPISRVWNDQFWAAHDLDHPQYNCGINPLY